MNPQLLRHRLGTATVSLFGEPNRDFRQTCFRRACLQAVGLIRLKKGVDNVPADKTESSTGNIVFSPGNIVFSPGNIVFSAGNTETSHFAVLLL